jgi:serine/threonine-protein kinase
MKQLIGTTLGQYEIKSLIGRGGMAYVFKAYQTTLDRDVALKVLPPSLAEDPGFTERFQREALAIAKLHHPNILPVYDFGVQDDYTYIAMRYVENSQTLGDLMKESTPLNQLIDYIVQVAGALNYAHSRNIVHRDVKPGNILIDGDWALLSDFGLVKLSESDKHLTSTGTSMGTPAYMSPEQVVGKGVDRRSDIYALGVILHKVLTGAIPHDAPTPIAIMHKRSHDPVPPLRQLKPDVPESLEHVVLRSLANHPDDRYSTAIDFSTALKKAQEDPSYREPTLTDLPLNEATMLSRHDLGQSPAKSKKDYNRHTRAPHGYPGSTWNPFGFSPNPAGSPKRPW